MCFLVMWQVILGHQGEKEGNVLFEANVWHNRSNVIFFVVTLIGVGKTWIFHDFPLINLLFD